jgi:hypothetical protein
MLLEGNHWCDGRNNSVGADQEKGGQKAEKAGKKANLPKMPKPLRGA